MSKFDTILHETEKVAVELYGRSNVRRSSEYCCVAWIRELRRHERSCQAVTLISYSPNVYRFIARNDWYRHPPKTFWPDGLEDTHCSTSELTIHYEEALDHNFLSKMIAHINLCYEGFYSSHRNTNEFQEEWQIFKNKENCPDYMRNHAKYAWSEMACEEFWKDVE